MYTASMWSKTTIRSLLPLHCTIVYTIYVYIRCMCILYSQLHVDKNIYILKCYLCCSSRTSIEYKPSRTTTSKTTQLEAKRNPNL